MNPLFRVLLFPFGMLYNLVMRFRNHLYDIGYKKSFQFQTMVVSVGNLSMGGNGKTPMVEYLIRMLQPNYHLAVLSRGYGRSSSGFKLATSTHNTNDIGDEPLQIFRKFSPEVTVAVGESRALAIPNILLEKPEVDLIILDDAFQHRAVNPQVSVLVTDYQNPFFKDYLFPSGMLREARSSVSRADVVVVTKCPATISVDDRKYYEEMIGGYCDLPVFFTTIEYQSPRSFTDGKVLLDQPPVVLLTGIAKAESLVEYVGNRYQLLDHLSYKDHHNYQPKDFEIIRKRLQKYSDNAPIVLTTEKDMVRLIPHQKELQTMQVYYIPIECKFVEGEQRFNHLILNQIEK